MTDAAVPMQCVILAGGLGTRMRHVDADRPKALLPVCGRPFVDHQLELLATGGVQDVVLCVGYGGEEVRTHVGDGSRLGLRISYVEEGTELKGTAGALRLALDEGALKDAFAVLYGDSYLPIELEPVWAAFRASRKPALMTVFRNENRWDTSNVVFEDGLVVLYDKSGKHPSPAQRRWIDYGLSVLSADVIDERVLSDAVADLADVFHELSIEGKLAGFEAEERFYEVGSPNGLSELEAYLSGRQQIL